MRTLLIFESFRSVSRIILGQAVSSISSKYKRLFRILNRLRVVYLMSCDRSVKLKLSLRQARNPSTDHPAGVFSVIPMYLLRLLLCVASKMCFGDIQINACPGKSFFVEVSRFNDFLPDGFNTVKTNDLPEIIKIAKCKHSFYNQTFVPYIVNFFQVDVPE